MAILERCLSYCRVMKSKSSIWMICSLYCGRTLTKFSYLLSEPAPTKKLRNCTMQSPPVFSIWYLRNNIKCIVPIQAEENITLFVSNKLTSMIYCKQKDRNNSVHVKSFTFPHSSYSQWKCHSLSLDSTASYYLLKWFIRCSSLYQH